MHVLEFQVIAVGITRREFWCLVAPDLRIGLQQLVVGESADLAIEVAVICCGWGGFVTDWPQ